MCMTDFIFVSLGFSIKSWISSVLKRIMDRCHTYNDAAAYNRVLKAYIKTMRAKVSYRGIAEPDWATYFWLQVEVWNLE